MAVPALLASALPALGNVAATAGTALLVGASMTTGMAAGIAFGRWAFDVDLMASAQRLVVLQPQAFTPAPGVRPNGPVAEAELAA